MPGYGGMIAPRPGGGGSVPTRDGPSSGVGSPGGMTLEGLGSGSVPSPWGAVTGRKTTYAKGGNIRSASYAEGGAVLGRERSFMKSPDQFRLGTADDDLKEKIGTAPEEQDYAGGKPKGRDKSLTPVKPRA